MRIHFISLGCDKNLVDSEIMLGIINEAGYVITANEAEADVIIVNTCGFIKDANAEGVDTILRMADYKKHGVCKAVVVTGCMVERYKEDIFNEIPEVDAIVGVGDFDAIGRVIQEAAGGRRVQLVTDKNRELPADLSLKRMVSTPGYYAYLKIAEGCDNCCTYCTIPSIRGKYRSRKMEDVVTEAEMLAKRGVKELILVAQDTAYYGKDIYGQSALHQLLAAISKIDGIVWIRVLYAYPEHISDETIKEMAENPKVCHYLDMPLQHADNGILKRMGRGSSREQLLHTIRKLRNAMPDISLRTTFITGFPGETDEAFQTLCNFATEIRFDKLGVFEYSKEDGTAAARMKDQITKKVKKQRRDILMRLQKGIAAEKSEKQLGRVLKVIVDGKIPDEAVYCGRSAMDCPDVDGLVFFEYDGELLSGEFVDVTVTHYLDYDLYGVLQNESAE